MEFEQRDYFRENADPTVPGFTVVWVDSENGYRIVEKWNRSDGDARWTAYWLDPDELQSRLSDNKCEHVGKLSDDQFDQVRDKIPGELQIDAAEKAEA